jgi:hypothetical protein
MRAPGKSVLSSLVAMSVAMLPFGGIAQDKSRRGEHRGPRLNRSFTKKGPGRLHKQGK